MVHAQAKNAGDSDTAHSDDGPQRQLAIAEFMSGLNATLGTDLGAVWSKITTGALRHVPGVDHASITVVDRGSEIRGSAPTDEAAAAIENVQQLYLQGPGVEAAHRHRVCRVDDLPSESRWPTFVVNSAGTSPVRSILSVPLFRHGDTRGALMLLADEQAAFRGQGEVLGRIFGLNASVIVEAAHREKRFQHLLSNHELVGEAKGMLMERFGIDAMEASSLLNQLSSRQGRSIPSTARKLLREKKTPGQPHG